MIDGIATESSDRKGKRDFSLYSTISHVISYFRWRDRIGNMLVLYRSKYAIYSVGPHWPGIFVVVALVLGGTKVNLDLVMMKSNVLSLRGQLIFKIVIFTLMVSTLVFLLLTAIVDPGIVQSTQVSVDEERQDRNYTPLDDCHYCDI